MWHHRIETNSRQKIIEHSSCQRSGTYRLGVPTREGEAAGEDHRNRNVSLASVLLLSKPTHKSGLSRWEMQLVNVLTFLPSSNFGRKENWARHCHGFVVHRHQVPNPSFRDSHIRSHSSSKPDCPTRRNTDEPEAVASKWDIDCFRACSRVQRSRACPGSSLWCRAGFLGYTVRRACLGFAFCCFYQSYYDLLSTRVSSVSDSPALRWFKWEKRK